MRILIVIHARNQGSTLADVANAALATGYDLLVIDDGSDDNCLMAIAELPCRTIRFEKHRGKAAVLLFSAGQAAESGYDALVTIDGDGRHNPADIPLLAAKAEKNPTPCLVIGSRQGASVASFWVRLECGLELPDIENSFRLYPVKELLAIQFSRSDSCYAIETIVQLAWAGVQVSSVLLTVSSPSADERRGLLPTTRENISRIKLHTRLVTRRLLPWPHKKLIEEAPFHQKISESISRNPLKVLGKICGEHTSPLWLAMAVWVGIFMGALPLFAIHTIAIIYVTHRLHLNKVAAVAASQFCMPPVVPVLCIQMGYYLRNGELLLDFSWQRWLLEIHERFWEWLIGSLLIGPLLGLIGAGVMYWMATGIQKRKDNKSGIPTPL